VVRKKPSSVAYSASNCSSHSSFSAVFAPYSSMEKLASVSWDCVRSIEMNRKILRVCVWNAGVALAASPVIVGHLCQPRMLSVLTEWSLRHASDIDGQPIWARRRERTSQTPYNTVNAMPAISRSCGSLRVSESGCTLCHVERSETSLTLSESLMGY
jgi:hypothetical protein